MLKDQDRIFKNLYNDLGAELNSAKKRVGIPKDFLM